MHCRNELAACATVQIDTVIPNKVVATLSGCSGGFGLKGATGPDRESQRRS